MWNDNETDIDLLGFEYLVDSLEILLSEPDLLPLTVGVLGDWGSGKSSLMRIAKARLDERSRPTADEASEGTHLEKDAAADRETSSPFITVAFSPWRFEDYTQVKLALMTAVIDAVERRISDLEEDSIPKHRLARVRRLLGELKRLKTLAIPAAAAGASAFGVPPEVIPVLTAGAEAVTGTSGEEEARETASDSPRQDGLAPDSMESIAEFHTAFERLLNSIEDVQAVVVFIDDMDRCTTPAIVDTFEAIRLFLHAPKTAYVLGLNEPIITVALEERYPERTAADESRGQQYLEKMIQTSVSIPPLSEPEVRAYVSLLYARRHLTPAHFEELRTEADRRRAQNPNGEAMNLGVARDTLNLSGDFPQALERDLEIATRVGGPLASGLRGNPRQVKRFLNRLELRLRVAQKRELALDPEALSKLMVLEETSLANFEKLFHWQIDHNGTPPHLEVAEAVARNNKPPKVDDAIATEATDWAEQPKVQAWLKSEPSLVGVALGPYFTFSRDRLTTSGRGARLSPEQQQLLTELQNTSESLRTAAVEEALRDPQSLPAIVEVLLERLPTAVSSKGTKSVVEIAGKHAGTAAALFEELQALAAHRLTQNFALWLGAELGTDPRLEALVADWRTGKVPAAADRAFDTYLKRGK